MKIHYQRNIKKFSLVFLSVLISWSFNGYAAGTAGKCERVTAIKALSSSAIAAGYTAQNWSGAGDSASQSSLGLPNIVSVSSLTSFQPGVRFWRVLLQLFLPPAIPQPMTQNKFFSNVMLQLLMMAYLNSTRPTGMMIMAVNMRQPKYQELTLLMYKTLRSD